MSIFKNFFGSLKQESNPEDVLKNNEPNPDIQVNKTEANIAVKNNLELPNNQVTTNIFYIRNIDIDELPSSELTRIITAVGSKNLAHYLALIVNLENRSRKISPEIKAKVLSSKNLTAPNESALKISKLTPILNSASSKNVKK